MLVESNGRRPIGLQGLGRPMPRQVGVRVPGRAMAPRSMRPEAAGDRKPETRQRASKALGGDRRSSRGRSGMDRAAGGDRAGRVEPG